MPSDRIKAELAKRRSVAAYRATIVRGRDALWQRTPATTAKPTKARSAAPNRSTLFFMRPRFTTYCRFVGDPLSRKVLTHFTRERLPAGVMPPDMLRALPRDRTPPLDAGVYFLWRGPLLLYVGQSTCLNNRLHSHWSAKMGLTTGKQIPFTWRSWLVCDEDDREDIETLYIRAYLPPYNDKIP